MFNLRKIFARASGYDAGRPSSSRSIVSREVKNEDGILNGARRSQLIAVHRDAFRNTSFAPATALQLQVNVVGTEGGKLTLTTSDEEFNSRCSKAFRKWSRHCGFTDGISLNEMLQLLLVQLTHNDGDFIAVFDDGCLTGGKGSGLLRIFESDEIKNVCDAEWERVKGDGEYQSNGLVYNKYGQIVGAFVSTRGRENEEFAKGEYLHLRLSSPADFSTSNWVFVANRWRNNQGRGISTSTHIANLMQDLAETQGSEVQAAKLNAGLGIIISDTTNEQDSEADDSSFDSGEDDRDVQADYEAAEAAENAALKKASTNLCAGKSAIIKLSGQRKIDSFKSERPNLDIVQFIRDLKNESGTVYGLPSCYTTLEPAGSYTAFRGAMIMAEKTFAKLRKKLERDFLDWVATRFILWSGLDAPDDFEADLLWRWNGMPEVDEGAYQSAIEKSITNGSESLTSLFGPDRVRKIVEQQSTEKELFERAGLIYPASRAVNGFVVEGSNNEENEDES